MAIYHIVRKTEFLDCFDGQIYTPSSLAECGFVHCALEHSVVPVANDFFNGVTDTLLVLKIDEDKLDAIVKQEPAAPDAGAGLSHLENASDFPHIYGPVNGDAITGIAMLQKSVEGYTWPSGFEPFQPGEVFDE